MSQRPAIDIGEVARMLRDRVEQLARELLPNGVLHGRLWRTGNIEDDRGQSLAVHLSGSLQGLWFDYAAGAGARDARGDMLDLVALVKFAGDKGRGFAWAKSWLGLDGMDPQRLQTERARATIRAEGRQRQAAKQAEWRRRKALSLFYEPDCRVPIIDTPAELYLASRGIDLSLLGHVSSALGFHPAVKCGPLDCDLPAMIARIIDGEGRQIGTHRTFIEPRGDGLWSKAGVPEPKMALGDVVGGYVPLSKGASRETLRLMAAGEPVAVSEGIEDGMTVACACPELRVLAAINLSNIANLPLPPHCGLVTIVGQNDAAGSPAAAALERVVEQLVGRGFKVAIARPPAGVKDANDLVTPAAWSRAELAKGDVA